MSFFGNIKRSLGFEGDLNNMGNTSRPSYGDLSSGQSPDLNNSYDYDYNAFDLDSITPQESLDNIILTRPRDTDDMDYVYDQVVQARNPVIVDLSELKRAESGDYRIAGEMLTALRKQHNAHAILLNNSKDKSLILIAPESVNIVRK